jgi:mannose-6-phosphate isomerase-like protein (cupin superfamily)
MIAPMSIHFLKQAELPASSFSNELVGAEFGGIPACVIFVDAEPGRGPSLHKHPYAELFFVLEGEGTFSDGKDDRVVGAGEVVIVPLEKPHAFVSSGDVRLRQIDVHLSPRFETDWLESASAE